MKPLTALFIRACKSKNPLKRCQSVYNRFYIHETDQRVLNKELSYLLAKICDEQIVCLSYLDALDIINTVDKYNGVLDNINESIVKTYISKIRYHAVDEFKEVLPLPLRFKK